jgi:membrane protease YdiL (CAAX protease family)
MEQNTSAQGSLARFIPAAPVSVRTIVWSGLTGIALALPLLCLVNLLPLPGLDAMNLAANAKRMQPLYVNPFFMVLKAVLLMPLAEEFFFRGILLHFLRRTLPLWVAVGLPTLMFGMTHLGFGFPNAVLALLLGAYFSWLVIRSGSFLTSALCHAGVNLCALFVIKPVAEVYGLTSLASLARPLPMLWVGLAIGTFATGVAILGREFNRRSLVTTA